jgi:spore coat protein H
MNTLGTGRNCLPGRRVRPHCGGEPSASLKSRQPRSDWEERLSIPQRLPNSPPPDGPDSISVRRGVLAGASVKLRYQLSFASRCAACFLAGAVLWALAGSLRAASSKELHRAEADVFFTNQTILTLSLEVSDDGLAALRKSPRDYVRATLRDGETVLTNVAVHLKGGSGSFRKVDDRPGFTVDFNRYDSGGRFHGLKKIHLNNGAQDPTRLSEFVGGELFREAGVPAARAAHALLTLNGRRLGLYVILESLDKEFLTRNFQDPHGNLYGQTRGCDITNAIERMEGDGPLTYDDLKALAAAVAEPDPQRRAQRLEQTLDVERFLSFMAMEVLLCHWDGYTFNRHNYRIYQDPGPNHMVFIPHDLDQLVKRPNTALVPPARGLTAQAVLNTPALRARYLARVRELASQVYVVPRLTHRIDQAVAALLPTLTAYDRDLATNFIASADEFKTRIVGRGLQLQRQFDILDGKLPTLAFRDGTARLTNWQAESHPAVTQLSRVKSADHKSDLWIKLGGTNSPNGAAWRTSVLLGPGWYRFEGRVRCAGVDSARWRRGDGAGLVSGYNRQPENFRLRGDLTWQKMSVDFEVTTTGDVDLGCDLRADQGEAWFAEDSLQLTRLPAAPPTPPTLRERRQFVLPGSTTDLALQTVEAAASQAARDPTRPIFHFRPPAQWMGGVCGVLQFNGRSHLFFQFNPWSDTSGPGTGWGHATSPNLLRWQILPPALLPDAQNGSTLDGPGSATLDGYGRPILFFTQTPEGFPKHKRQQWAALPMDEQLIRWQRVDLGLLPGQSGVPSGIAPGWGGMSVFRVGERTFATFEESKGLICEAQCRGLTQWKALKKISELSSGRPELFTLDGRCVQLQSSVPTSYRVGEFDTNKIAFRSQEKQARPLDYGPEKKGVPAAGGLAGATVFTDSKGRAILLGGISGFKSQGRWDGVLSLPRRLRLEGDQILQEPLPELAQLRGRRLGLVKPVTLTNSTRFLDNPRGRQLGNALELRAEILPGTATNFGVRLRGAQPGAADIVVRYTPGRLNVAGREVAYTHPAGTVFTLRLFLDKSVLETFIDDGQLVVTQVIAPAAADVRPEIFAEGGTVLVQQFETWEMRPLW